jgi:hypothetical protein
VPVEIRVPEGRDGVDESTAGLRVEDLEKEYQEGKKQVGKVRLLGRIGSFTATCLIIGFLWSIVVLARDSYAWDQFEPHVKAEAERLAPEAKATANRVFGRAGHVYAKLAQEKLESSLPEVQESLRRELEEMGTGVAERAGPKVEAALDRLEEKQWERLGRQFPAFATDGTRAQFAERWKMEILDENREMFVRYQVKYGQEVIDLRKTLDGFRPNRFEEWDEDRLTRHFVHLWLQLLDRHILSKDYPGDVEQVNDDL